MAGIDKALSEGFNIWRNNLTICIPFVIKRILITVILAVLFLAIIVPAVPSLEELAELSEVTGMSETGRTEMSGDILNIDAISDIVDSMLANLESIIMIVFIGMLITIAVSAYFDSGGIGMIKEVVENGTTNVSQMTQYGMRHFRDMFLADLAITLMLLAGLLFFIPGLMPLMSNGIPRTMEGAVELFSTMTSSTGMAMAGAAVIYIIYAIIITLFFALTMYAVVVDELETSNALMRSYEIFRANKFMVFIFILVVSIIAILIELAGSVLGMVPYIGGVMSMLLSVVVVEPLSFAWYTSFYKDVTRKDDAPRSMLLSAEDLQP